MKHVVLVTAALVAAVAVLGVVLPPARLVLPSSWDDGSVVGIVHVHSRASDGRGTLDEIAAAAARARLQFVVVTDHGDASRRPEPPSYRSGVLLLDAVEISTRGGHYIALGLPQAPYALGGEAADVVDDVRRLGGFGVAAHPDSPKPELRWQDWSAPVDGVELINPDTSWRVHAFAGGVASKWLLLRALLAYPVRSAESIAQLLTDNQPLRARWIEAAATRTVVAMAGADAHAKLAMRDTEPGDNSSSVPIPSYESLFTSLSVHVVPVHPFTRDAAADAAALLGGLRAGHSYVAVDGWASRAAFSFSASRGDLVALAGDTLAAGEPITLQVRSNAPAGWPTNVWKGTARIAERTEPVFDLPVSGEPAVYSVEVRKPGQAGQPAWLTSNPIYVRDPRVSASAIQPAAVYADGQSLFDGRTTTGWSWEGDATSQAAVDFAPLVTGARVRLRYGLSGGAKVGQYAAAAVDTPRGAADAAGVRFLVRGDAPMRISLQVRAEVPGFQPERWERSVYLDATEAERTVRFSDMHPVGKTHAPTPPAGAIRSIMFVVDTTNSLPGSSGRLWLGAARLVRAK